MAEDTKPFDPARVSAVLDKVLPFAGAADALARGTVGKVRGLALLGLLAALWITYACAVTFAWGLEATLIAFVLSSLPVALLWKIHGTLRATVGLPQRISDTAKRLIGKGSELKQHFESRGQQAGVNAAPGGFRRLWETGKAMLEVKSLGDEAQEVVSLAAGAMILANPVFAIVLAATAVVTMLLIGVAGVVGLAYLF